MTGTRERAGWDEYFMRIAVEVAGRSTCDRKHVGAVIVRDRNILSTGYNGSIAGMPHCDDVGHLMEGGHCIATIHAEANAIIQAAKNGVMINGASIYTTASPCWNCFKIVVNAGMRRIFFGELYRDERIFSIAAQLGIELTDLSAYLPSDRPESGDLTTDEVNTCAES
ncbi:MAG: dCMP deaminase family protein [Planctomycetota bacterium]|nr:dCMP deaminase family protein [Planctomycetota bacterium]